jgi:hypothetical protein
MCACWDSTEDERLLMKGTFILIQVRLRKAIVGTTIATCRYLDSICGTTGPRPMLSYSESSQRPKLRLGRVYSVEDE